MSIKMCVVGLDVANSNHFLYLIHNPVMFQWIPDVNEILLQRVALFVA